MIARASSGSSSAISSVEPLISANSALTVFRSPSRDVWVSDASEPTRIPGFLSEVAMEALVEVAAAELSSAPHSPQNLADGMFSKLQLAQGRFNAVPHSLQNFSPSGFSALQLAHRIGPPFARLQLSGRQIVRG